ncbi:MAG: exodeoxyribonuclease VII small subunit [Dehalococcoidia bacterium]|nr:exodeoxyribonuclease VII small subunit [Dehalococcoidia bacterium]
MTDSTKERFEDVYARLEEAVRRLEDGGLPLDDAIAAYEEGMALARHCRDLLENAELRIARVRDGFTEDMDTP